MKRTLMTVGTLALWAAACAGPADLPPTATRPEPLPTAQAAAPTAQAAPAAASTTPAAAPTALPSETPFVISEDFVPTDPATVNLAAGKPQLVEFFAFW